MSSRGKRPGILIRYWRIVVNAAGTWLARNAFVHAGSLAFYTLFSMAPVVVLFVGIAGMVFGREAATGQIVAYLGEYAGASAAQAVQEMVQRSRPEVVGLFPTIAGFSAVLVGATTVFAQLQISLNQIWGVTTRPKANNLVVLVWQRLISLAMVLTVGFILLVSLLLNVTIHAVMQYADGSIRIAPVLLVAAELTVSFAMIALLFAVIFKILPDVKVEWADVWAGALMTAALFIGGRYLIAAYLTYTAPDSPFGAAGALVLLLMWVYYSALILLFGTALTKAHLLVNGRKIVPKKMAVRVREEFVEVD